jgi:peptidoglycan/xylan/chitin deacetylase (PgdA/CDA1 family)
MDVEDWYHLEYFFGVSDKSPSMLDGLDRFHAVLADEGVRATFFVVGELASSLRTKLLQLAANGHEIASHGPDHGLVTRLSTTEFVDQMREEKRRLEDVVGLPVRGYRAPCLSMNREKLERLPELGFGYDSSWIRDTDHPLYVSMSLTDWEELVPGVRKMPNQKFAELEVSTVKRFGRNVPVAGGAYFRVFPWPLTRELLRPLLAAGRTYVFYIHPFECSARQLTGFPPGTRRSTALRFELGRRKTLPRLRKLIRTLRAAGYRFATCGELSSALTD